MARPSWFAPLAELKPISPLFNWWLNMLLAKKSASVRKWARQADHAFRTDRHGWTGPAFLFHMFTELGDHEAALLCKNIRNAIRASDRLFPLMEHHHFPIHKHEVEIATLTDPETPTGTGDLPCATTPAEEKPVNTKTEASRLPEPRTNTPTTHAQPGKQSSIANAPNVSRSKPR